MADKIDKALPNEPLKKNIHVPAEEEIVEAQEEIQESPEGVEVTEQEDGSVDIDFDPAAASMEGSDEHYANLAEFLPDQVLSEIGADLSGKYMDYSMGRKEWERTYTTGLDLL